MIKYEPAFDDDFDDLAAPLAGLNTALLELLKTQIAVIIDDSSMTTEQKAETIAGMLWDAIKEP